MIERIAEEIPEEAVLYLINALSLDAEWENIYRQDQILDREFTTEEGLKQPAELMYSSSSMSISTTFFPWPSNAWVALSNSGVVPASMRPERAKMLMPSCSVALISIQPPPRSY